MCRQDAIGLMMTTSLAEAMMADSNQSTQQEK
jgi:hypothetical protein